MKKIEVSTHTVTAVLVHGAWTDESSWSKVVDLLHLDGIKAVTVHLPLSSLNNDVAALEKTLNGIPGPVVLVGHAYAGAVITSARSFNVRALVYIAGLAPDRGETVADVFYRYKHSDNVPKLIPDSNGWIRLPMAVFASTFAQDATPKEQEVLAVAQSPISSACINAPVGQPLWRSIPSWYLVAERDRMIPAKTQRFMGQRMKAYVCAYSVDHLPMITAPELVTRVIAEAIGLSTVGTVKSSNRANL